MKKHLSMFILCVFMMAAPGVSPTNASETIQVAVSILPQVYFVERIGGDRVDVLCMLPKGGLPHNYEPTAQQMKQLSQADLYVRIAVEFENAWWDRMSSANPGMHVIDSTLGVKFLEGHAHEHHEEGEEHEHEGEHHDEEGEEHEHEGEHHEDEGEEHEHHEEDSGHHEHHGRDPHVWLSPRSVKIQAENIYQGLIAVDPEHKDSYLANKEVFLSELDSLDAEIQDTLATLKTRRFMIFHPAWSYFARDYDLEQIPVEIEGKEPSAKEMTELMHLAQEEHVAVIFVQPQTSRRSAETIAKQIGARLEILDPLAADWPENMRRVAGALAESLSD
jgi:zinc transport system substrate-binding protein